MLNLLNEKNQVQKLVEAIEEYQGQTIVVSSWIKDKIENKNGNSYRLQTMNSVEVNVTDKNICFDTDEDTIEFSLDEIGNTYIDKLDIFKDNESEIHTIFDYMNMRYSILNIV